MGRVERRNFLKGLGALGVTLGFGSRVISREADRELDSVIQDGVERGLYSSDTAEEFLSVPEIDVQLSEPIIDAETTKSIADAIRREIRKEPTLLDSMVNHDWSKELGYMIEKDFDVHVVDPNATTFQWAEPANVQLMRKEDSERYVTLDSMIHRAELEHMYCSFIVSDEFMADVTAVSLRDLFFIPALATFKRFIEEESEGKRLAVQRMAIPNPSFGIKGHVSDGGPIPIRCTAQYDIANAGVRFNLEFRAKVF
jgi:hypothetical protein